MREGNKKGEGTLARGKSEREEGNLRIERKETERRENAACKRR